MLSCPPAQSSYCGEDLNGPSRLLLGVAVSTAREQAYDGVQTVRSLAVRQHQECRVAVVLPAAPKLPVHTAKRLCD